MDRKLSNFDVAVKRGAAVDADIQATAGSIGAAELASNAVTTVKVTDANVTLAKLASGITPSHVVKYAGVHTYGGGGTSSAATVTGVVGATDIVIGSLKAATNAVYLYKTVGTDNTITFTFSGDPGASTVVSYMVLRAAA